MIPDIDSRLSRNILKSISYGLPLAEVVPDHTYAQLETRLGELKRRYLELRISHGARELPFSNYLFYLILQSRHQEFDFKLRQGNSVVTNIHRFKSKGRIPSLTTLLLADAVNAKSELELKHPDIPQLDRHARDIERWLAAGNVMPPSERALRGLVEALERAAGEGRPLHLVSAVCPDYSHSSDAEGKPRYTFERVGDQPGLAGAKLVSAGQAVAELARARQVEIRHAILGGEFEYLSFNRNPATGETREGFLGKVERQLERIAGALPCPAATCSFFEMCGGEDGWHRAHGEIVQRLEQGDYGQTGLDYPVDLPVAPAALREMVRQPVARADLGQLRLPGRRVRIDGKTLRRALRQLRRAGRRSLPDGAVLLVLRDRPDALHPNRLPVTRERLRHAR